MKTCQIIGYSYICMSEDDFREDFENYHEGGIPVPNPDDRIWRHPSETGRLNFRSPKKLWYKKDLSVNLSVFAVGAIVIGSVLAYLFMIDMRSSPVDSVKGSTVSEILNGKPKFSPGRQIQYEKVGLTLQNMVSTISSSIVSVASTIDSRHVYSTGAVVDSNGDILVSAGAVQPNAQVIVTTMSNKSYKGSYVGSDTESGLGLVKVKGLNLKPINLASSSDFVENTIVVNICREHVNGKLDVSISKILDVNEKKQINYSEATIGLLAADPPIPDVSDGGVLVDSSGNLVGIENLLAPSNAGTKNYSSTEVAKWVIDDLESSGDVDHGWLGIQGTTVPNKGVKIQTFLPNSPCQSTGIQIGDLIEAFNGTTVVSLKQLQLELYATTPNQVVTLTVDRGSQIMTFKVTLESN